MTEIFDEETKKALIDYRIGRAKKTLVEVDVLLANGLYSTAVNRLYYAVYYAAISLLFKYGFSATTHSGVRSMLGLHFIRTGKLSNEIGSYFMILFERRHRNDYDDFVECSREEVEGLRPMALAFIEAVEKMLN